MLSVSVLAQGIANNGDADLFGKDENGGIFETEGSSLKFPEMQDTNVDALTVGNDKALAFGNIWQRTLIATATNNLEIKKNQDSGESHNLTDMVNGLYDCADCGPIVNIDQITVGNREAVAFGFASATNNVRIVADQQ